MRSSRIDQLRDRRLRVVDAVKARIRRLTVGILLVIVDRARIVLLAIGAQQLHPVDGIHINEAAPLQPVLVPAHLPTLPVKCLHHIVRRGLRVLDEEIVELFAICHVQISHSVLQ